MPDNTKPDLSLTDLAAMLDALDEGVIAMTLDGTIESWNTGAERIFGYSPDEMAGKNILALFPEPLIGQKEQIFQRVRQGERIEIYETQRKHKDGSLVDISLTYMPRHDELGRITGALHISRAISERKRLERAERDQKLLASIVSSADEAIVSKDLNGIVTSWNRAAERIFGYTAQEMIGRPIHRLIPRAHLDEEPLILERIRRGERIEQYETKRVRKDGRIVEVALTVSPMMDPFGRVVGASKIARDITAQKQSEARERAALREAETSKRQAEQANRTKDEFIATISHELRTPMTAIVGWSRMLLGNQLPTEMRQRAIEAIDKNARSQAQLIEDLLDISRIVSGKLRVEFKVLDLTAAIKAAIEAVRPTADAKRVRIQMILGVEDSLILGDFERMKQVLWNLLSNAVRFTPPEGSIKVELQLFESQLELRVSDTGAGIKPEFLPHIFDRFTQADSSLKRSHGGLGMGLAIVKSIVQLHGGTVFASSPGLNEGSVFTVRLPMNIVRRDRAADGQTDSGVLEAWQERHELVGLKILVVDDQQDTCDLLRHVFDECGAIVETAQNARNALQVLDRWDPDILISDISMPSMDGYELIHTIRENRKSRIPAIALTAMARIDDRVKALNAGFQMHVAKPVDPMELISIVRSLTGLVNRH